MSETEAIELFVEPMRRRFTVPTGIEPDAFSADLAEALANYSAHQLDTAAKHFRDTRTVRSFPTVAECRQACERFTAVPLLSTAPKYESEELKRSLEHTRRQQRIEAFRLCRGDIGRRADREGWLQTLVEFATENRRMPSEREAEKLKAFSAEVDANLHREPRPAQYRQICEWRQTMKDKAHEDVFGFIEKRQAAE